MAGVKQPDDKSYFILPDLGEGVHEAELIKWRVRVGDVVKEHQTLAEMETDKALVEVSSPWNGVIGELCGNAGDTILVGSVLVRYAAKRAAVTGAPKTVSAPVKQPAAPVAAAKIETKADTTEDAGTVVGNVSGSLGVPSRFARQPEHESVSSGPNKSLATPAVRRIAKELGVNIQQVRGTGRGGRVTASDLQAVSQGAADVARETTASRVVIAQPITHSATNNNTITTSPAAISVAYPSVNREGVKECIPFRGIRRKIAQALDLSVKTAVHFTVVDTADVTKLDRKRKEYAAALGTKLSMLPFVMLAVCKALRKHPTLNANVDDANEEILIKEPIHLGCAVDTDHGLMVPVLRNAHQKNVGELATLVKELAESCKERTVARENLVGGTFTMSNVGSYGGAFATPIINYPEVAILAVGRAREQVLTKDGTFYAGLVLPLSLSCDHRIVDGAEGAKFLNTVLGFLENPDRLLV
ncbi:MAG: 2-oxo acid dehydrogenase subunit E2 [Phycisphaerales bacterium]|nr:2-oxo acid dehydrogenase subunit E2 [Phycisphaerales bacterium]